MKIALQCFASRECSGCASCYKERESLGGCIICGREIRAGDDSLLTSGGLVCDDADCIFQFALSEGTDKDIEEYIRLHKEDLLFENKEEIINSIIQKRAASIELYSFVSQDKSSYGEFWCAKHGYCLLPSV